MAASHGVGVLILQGCLLAVCESVGMDELEGWRRRERADEVTRPEWKYCKWHRGTTSNHVDIRIDTSAFQQNENPRRGQGSLLTSEKGSGQGFTS